MVQSPYVTKIKRDVAMSFITFVADTGQVFSKENENESSNSHKKI